jgi:hypothetical protein
MSGRMWRAPMSADGEGRAGAGRVRRDGSGWTRWRKRLDAVAGEER